MSEGLRTEYFTDRDVPSSAGLPSHKCHFVAVFKRSSLWPGSCCIPAPVEGTCMWCIAALLELSCEVKKRKKLDPTSIALPAASAASIAVEEVMPLLPSAAGQSLWLMISTGLTSHQIAPVLTRELSTTWL